MTTVVSCLANNSSDIEIIFDSWKGLGDNTEKLSCLIANNEQPGATI